MSKKFVVYKNETARTGILGNVFIVEQDNQLQVSDLLYVFSKDQKKSWNEGISIVDRAANGNETAKQLYDDIEANSNRFTMIERYSILPDARYAALEEQTGKAFRAQVSRTTDLTTLVPPTQVVLVFMMLIPVVISYGSALTAAAQAAVTLSVLMTNSPSIMTACRVSNIVVLANLVLCISSWYDIYNGWDIFTAVFRTAWVSVTSLLIVSANQYIYNTARPKTE
jgi:hypothetical protein